MEKLLVDVEKIVGDEVDAIIKTKMSVCYANVRLERVILIGLQLGMQCEAREEAGNDRELGEDVRRQ